MNRRKFLKNSLAMGLGSVGLLSCGKIDPLSMLAGPQTRSKTVTLYDVYAMALYMDGSMGPKTGIIKVDYIQHGMPLNMEFWHGHGGRNHAFLLTPQHYSSLKSLERVYITTDEVASHTHKLFIDPKDPKYRVPGSKPVEVSI